MSTSSQSHVPFRPVRLIAVDLDGTLLNDHKEISDRSAKALSSLPDRDIKVVIASARPPRSVRHIFAALRLRTWQINYNGALIWDEIGRRAVFHRPLPGKIVRQMIEYARGACPDVQVSCELMDRWYTDRMDQPYTTETGRLFRPDVIAPLETFADVPMTKLLLLGEPAMLTEIEPGLSMAFEEQATVVRTDPELLQIMDRRVSKATALKLVADHYKVPMTEVMAIGDAPNDVGMLRAAGISVAMHNAHPMVKKVAQWIAPSNNDHGVHAALARYGLCDA